MQKHYSISFIINTSNIDQAVHHQGPTGRTVLESVLRTARTVTALTEPVSLVIQDTEVQDVIKVDDFCPYHKS